MIVTVQYAHNNNNNNKNRKQDSSLPSSPRTFSSKITSLALSYERSGLEIFDEKFGPNVQQLLSRLAANCTCFGLLPPFATTITVHALEPPPGERPASKGTPSTPATAATTTTTCEDTREALAASMASHRGLHAPAKATRVQFSVLLIYVASSGSKEALNTRLTPQANRQTPDTAKHTVRPEPSRAELAETYPSSGFGQPFLVFALSIHTAP